MLVTVSGSCVSWRFRRRTLPANGPHLPRSVSPQSDDQPVLNSAIVDYDAGGGPASPGLVPTDPSNTHNSDICPPGSFATEHDGAR